MAVTTVLDKTGQIAMNENFDSNASSMYEVDTPNNNSKVKSAINYYHISQNTLIGREWHYNNDSGDWSLTLKNIVDEAKNGNIMLFSYWWDEYDYQDSCWESYGHTIVIKGYMKGESGEHILIAYDNRYPNSDFLLTIDENYSSCVSENGEEATTVVYKTSFEMYDAIDIDGTNNDMNISYTPSSSKTIYGTKITFKASGEINVKNSSGQTLTYNNGKISGTMAVDSVAMTTNTSADGALGVADVIVTVADSELFIFESANGKIDVSVLSDNIYTSAYAENADSVVINENTGVAINGNKLGNCRAHLGINNELCDMASVESSDGNNVSLLFSGEDIIVNGADGYNSTITVYDNTVDVDEYCYLPNYNQVLLTNRNGKFDIMASSSGDKTFDISVMINSEITIRTPSTTTISYGDSIALHADLTEALPTGWYIEWTADNGNFSNSVSADGTTCTISPSSSGSTTFTATVHDAEGNVVSTDEQIMTSKAGFFDKIIAFFKKLFGLTKIIPQAFKVIF